MRYRSYQGFTLNSIWVIIIINFIVFIATSISISLFYNLGLAPSALGLRPWTIVTNIFVHSGFWHIFGNMITLYFFGTFLYRMIGRNRFLLVYFVGGIVGNILYVLLGPPGSIVVGASGAIFALAGVLAVLVPNLRLFVYFIIPMRLWVAVLVFFVIWSFIPGVAWQAHLGGLLTGVVIGYFLKKGARYYSYQ